MAVRDQQHGPVTPAIARVPRSAQDWAVMARQEASPRHREAAASNRFGQCRMWSTIGSTAWGPLGRSLMRDCSGTQGFSPTWLRAVQKRLSKISCLNLFTLDPELKRFGEYGHGETDLGPIRGPRGEQPQSYNPRKQQENSPKRASGEPVVSGGWRRDGDWDPTLSGT